MRVAQQIRRSVTCYRCGVTKALPLRVRVGVTIGEPYQGHGGVRVRVRWDHGPKAAPLLRTLFPVDAWS